MSDKVYDSWKEYFEEAILTNFQLNPNVPKKIETNFQVEFATKTYNGYLT